MKILVIGSGGREHALAWRLGQSPSATQVFATPGNPGIARVATCVPAGDSSPATLFGVAEAVDADLTVVGPEAPLVAGVVDLFRERGRKIIGPTAEAARLEGSKIFAKKFFKEQGIPTADFLVAENQAEARKALDRFGLPVVIKTDGLAAGKGVVVAQDRATAEAALGSLRCPVVVEECLRGVEVSFIVLSDGRNVQPLAPTQDHKAVFDGDRGPNTGGMGAYSDDSILSESQAREVLVKIIHPTVEATRFTGFLYAGLMLTDDGPKVLEFNVRLGDPETQPLMHRLRSDFAAALANGARLEWQAEPAVCVVMASAGYPGAYETGKPIRGIEAAEARGITVFHAGTRQGPAGLETAGGRVLGVTASGKDLTDAVERAYDGVRQIQFDGRHYRRDIGRRYNKNVVPGT